MRMKMRMGMGMRMNTGAMHRWLDNCVAGGEIPKPPHPPNRWLLNARGDEQT
jgi:hypothetical protein